MRVEVRLELRDATRPTYSREIFWDEYKKAPGGMSFDGDQGETKLREKFASVVEDLINQRHEQLRRQITVMLTDMDYGGIEFILDIFGIDNEFMKDQLLYALELYCPLAFNQVLGSNVSLFTLVRHPMAIQIDSQKHAARVWTSAQTSLLVPVILALGVLYVASTILDKHNDRESQERIEFMKLLATRNDLLTTLVMEEVKNSNGMNKEMRDMLINLLKSRPTTSDIRKDDGSSKGKQ